MSVRIFDGHNDTLLWHHQHPADPFFSKHRTGHIDYLRARQGDMAGGFFAIFAPDPAYSIERNVHFTEHGYFVPLSPAYDPTEVRRLTDAVLDDLDEMIARSAGRLRVIRSHADAATLLSADSLSIVVHFEGAEAIDPDLNQLARYYERGLRSLGIVWSRPNCFGEGVPFAWPTSPDTGPGLTDAGRALVRACNQMGILLDLAHINERGFWDVASLTERPLVVTHTGVHTICQVSRNLTDSQIDAVGESNGVIGIAYDVSMIRTDGGLDINTPISAIADHICYIADRIGVAHVGLGSDFDGATISSAIGDVTGVPRLLDELAARGFDEVALAQVAGGNWQRVLETTL